MPVRPRNGKLEWRFKVDGHEYSKILDLTDTARNRIAAQRLEAAARQLVVEGRGAELRIQVQPFDSAVGAFNVWAQGEYAAHPTTWKRLAGSLSSAVAMFGRRPLASITHGDLEDYKSQRRTHHEVKEVTLRHDLHALSLLFQYGKKHHWCRENPIDEVEIPSDADATRCNVLSPADEARWFAAIDAMIAAKLARKKHKQVRALQDIRDLSVLMLNQGCRPEELRGLPQHCVDLERGLLTIQKGKSAAARRVLPMTAASRDVLAKRLQTPGTWVFQSQKYPARHIGPAQRMVEAVTAKSGLAMVMYDLRHTFATRAVERGVELPKLMAILGHSNLRSIMRYVHMAQVHIGEGMRKFEEGAVVAAAEKVAETKERVQ
jgi:site-specific recombinase XerD